MRLTYVTTQHKCIIPLHQGSFKIPKVKLFHETLLKGSRREKNEREERKQNGGEWMFMQLCN